MVIKSKLVIFFIEFSVLARQCLDRRIRDQETLKQEVAAWEANRNQENHEGVGEYVMFLMQVLTKNQSLNTLISQIAFSNHQSHHEETIL